MEILCISPQKIVGNEDIISDLKRQYRGIPKARIVNSYSDALELLRENPAPTREEIREAVSSNLCRCTGYQTIIESIELAVEKMHQQEAAE